MTLEFGLLGPVEVRDDGASVALGGPQQRRILATLVADAGRVVSIDRLIEAIWSEGAPEAARHSVMTYVSRLRLALGDGYVATQDPGYRLVVDEDAIDALRFERLVEEARRSPPTQAISIIDGALELWRGPAYGEFATEWWALPHATRLEELRIVATEERAEALIAAGEYERAVTDLEGLVRTYPLRERFVGQLMKAHDATGRRAEALRAYAHFREYLAEETGLEPSSALRDLEATIVTGDSAAGASSTRSLRGYVLDAVLGEGAFGTVYRSTQPGIGRDVAVKVIRADLADDPSFVRRFEAEAQLVAHLEHPHIVPLYDFWREPGGAYLVFRLLRGGNAEQIAQRDGLWDLERVTRVVDEIGGALATAHAAGVVHRDVKPANVLFDEAGNAYLADFGIAVTNIDPDADGAPESLASAGSPLYAPPEQFQRGAPTPRADQYSFAAMVWELLTGRPPYEGDSVSMILRTKLQRPVPSLRTYRPDVPEALDIALQRATATRPEDRYDDIASLVTAWHTALQTGVGTTGDLVGAGRPARARDVSSTIVDLAGEVANPYKGLRAFGEADARHFHGRGVLITELEEAVRKSSFVAVVGASGSGKSSLVHAGLVPRLRAADMRVVSMVPGDDPFAQLRLALLAAAVREPEGGGVVAMVRSVAVEAPEPLVVVIDQFEEMWTLAADEARETFLAGLAELAAENSELARVIVSMRADFFDRPLAHPALGPLVATHPFGVTPMTVSEMHEAVTAPAAELGVVFEPGLDSEIVADVTNQPASLPLLQFTLAELFERRSGAVIKRATYAAMGGIAGAIASRAEEQYAGLDDAGQDAARRLFLRLVVPGEGTEDTRRRVRRSELPPGTAEIADRFEAARLLVADRDPSTREPTIEVAHESLLRSWPRLRAWLGEDRDWIRRLQHVGSAAEAWAAAGRPESELYRGGRLDAATEVLDARADQLTPLESEFIDASRAAARVADERERRARRRLRRGFVATAIALVVALVAGAIAFVQRRDANTQAEAADVARLVSLSQSLTGTKRDIAMLLALEAERRAPAPATTGALQSALYSDPSFLGYLHTGNGSAGQIAFSRDGRWLLSTPVNPNVPPVRIDLTTHTSHVIPVRGLNATTEVDWISPVDDVSAVITRYDGANEKGQLTLERIALSDGHVLGETSFPGEPWEFDLSPDGKRGVVTTVGTKNLRSRAVVVNLATMEQVAAIDQPGPTLDVEDQHWFSGSRWIDDRRIVVGSPTGRMLVWEPATGAVPLRLNDPPTLLTNASRLEVSRDGSTVVAASQDNFVMAFDLATGKPRWPRAKEASAAIAVDSRNGVVWAQEAGFGSSRMFAYDLETGERTVEELNGQHGTVCDVAVSSDGTRIAIASCNEGTIGLWALDGRTATGEPLTPAGFQTFKDGWSLDGSQVLVWEIDGNDANSLVDVKSGKRAHAPDVGIAYFRPDGILRGILPNGHLVEFNPATGATRDTGVLLPNEPNGVTRVATLPERNLAVYGADSQDADSLIYVVDTARDKIVRKITSDLGAVYGVGFSADGKRVFAAGQKEEAQVFDVQTGKKIATLGAPAANIAVSPDHKLLATNAFNGTITFWDATTLQRTGDPLTGGTEFTPLMQFTPDGRTLISIGLGNSMRFFDVASRRQLGVAIPATDTNVAISPDSKTIAITTARGVQRFALDAGALRGAACRAAGRNLTAAEWRQYIGGTPRQLCREWPMN